MRRILSGLAVLLALDSGAMAHGAGDEKKGETVAVQHCSGCHAVLPGKLRSPDPMAPSFASVAVTPGMTDRAIRVWLQSSHPTMPNFILKPDERANIAAYIMSLKAEKSTL